MAQMAGTCSGFKTWVVLQGALIHLLFWDVSGSLIRQVRKACRVEQGLCSMNLFGIQHRGCRLHAICQDALFLLLLMSRQEAKTLLKAKILEVQVHHLISLGGCNDVISIDLSFVPSLCLSDRHACSMESAV
jgi:hypothetical protein